MNKNDVIVFGLVAAMVIAVATAVTARYPHANVGSVADWCAAVGTVFAASTALYIAHHEARRARETLIEERNDRDEREERLAADRADDMRRIDAIAVQAAIAALTEGLASCKSFKEVVDTADLSKFQVSAKAFLSSGRFTSPTAVMRSLMPGAANTSEAAAYLLQAKSTWGTCMSRVEMLSLYKISAEQAQKILVFDDAKSTLALGMKLHWRMCNGWPKNVPAEVSRKIERDLTKKLW